MTVHLHYKPGQQHQIDVMDLLSKGLIAHGYTPQIAPDWDIPKDCKFVVCWGDKVPEDISVPRLILEAGYVNGQSGNYHTDRLRFVSAGWNGMHGRADPVVLDCPPDRWERLGIEMSPWRDDGDYVLICDNHPGDNQSGPADWWKPLANLHSLHQVIYRPHPLMQDGMRPLSESLKNASFCATWSSTSAVESVLMGIPTLAYSPASIAWPVTSHELTETIYTGDRQTWAQELAYRQWSAAELMTGEAWEFLRHGL